MDGAMTDLSETEISGICDLCGGAAETSVQTSRFTYGACADAAILSASVPVTSCTQCGEAYTGEEGEILRHEAVCEHLNRLTPAQISRIRGSLPIEQFAQENGFDARNVARWERGNLIQDLESDLALRSLVGDLSELSAEVYDDEGRWIRPAFLDEKNSLTIFQDIVGRRRYVERNRYAFREGEWHSDGLPTCRDVIVRDEVDCDWWVVVPDEEARRLRARVYGVE